MARFVSRAIPLASRTSPRLAPAALALPQLPVAPPDDTARVSLVSPTFGCEPWRHRRLHVSALSAAPMPAPLAGFVAGLRGFSRLRRRHVSAASPASRKQQPPPKERELELCAKVIVDDDFPDDAEVLSIAELLKLNVPMAMKIAFDGLRDSEYKARETSITDVGKYEKVELSVLLCHDDCIQKLNKESRGEDSATDVLSMSQHIPDLDLPTLLLGDIVISVETAARQAEERGHCLLDEVRMLVVHGLLHLLGFDREISDEAEAEMAKEEQLVLKSLNWKGKGLIRSGNSKVVDAEVQPENIGKQKDLRFYRPKFSYIFCDMDGTLLNSKSLISPRTADALREAISRGVNIVIATGKARPAVITLLKKVDLAGTNGVVSESSPGVFLQGLLVYGTQGREIVRRNLDQAVCQEVLSYSLEHEVPVVAFSQDRCFTLYDHPLVDSLHSVYSEPKAEVVPSIEQLLASGDIQKLLFRDTVEGISSILRPYWEQAIQGRAGIVQAVPDMLEIVPSGTSKGAGVKLLLDHLGITPKEIMAIGDGENDVEMLQLASFSVALANGSKKAKAVASVVGTTNDEDGAAQAIYDYAF